MHAAQYIVKISNRRRVIYRTHIIHFLYKINLHTIFRLGAIRKLYRFCAAFIASIFRKILPSLEKRKFFKPNNQGLNLTIFTVFCFSKIPLNHECHLYRRPHLKSETNM